MSDKQNNIKNRHYNALVVEMKFHNLYVIKPKVLAYADNPPSSGHKYATKMCFWPHFNNFHAKICFPFVTTLHMLGLMRMMLHP